MQNIQNEFDVVCKSFICTRLRLQHLCFIEHVLSFCDLAKFLVHCFVLIPTFYFHYFKLVYLNVLRQYFSLRCSLYADLSIFI